MNRIQLLTDMFLGKSAAEFQRGCENLRDMLDLLTRINWRFLRDNPRTVPLYQSGVRYRDEPYGQEEWQDIPTLYKAQFGDCEDLACALAAERQRQGVAARATYKWKQIRIRSPKTGQLENVFLFHIIVVLPDGSIEDPSKRLGMGRVPSHLARLVA